MTKVVDVPTTQYAESRDGLCIAYQVLGEGPVDIALLPMSWSNVELWWDDPFIAGFFRRLGSLGRFILFDKRGSGLSDPVALRAIPTVEEWVDDLITVLDAVGSEHANLLGVDAGGPVAIVAAGTHAAYLPLGALQLLCTPRSRIGLPTRLPGGAGTDTDRDPGDFPRGVFSDVMLPSRVDDPTFRAWWARLGRHSVGLGAAVQMQQAVFAIDVRDVLGAVRQPTLVVHRADNAYIRADHGEYLR